MDTEEQSEVTPMNTALINHQQLHIPPSPTEPNSVAPSVSLSKRPHSLSPPLVLEHSNNDENFNMKDIIAQLKTTMVACFTSLRQDIFYICAEVTDMTATTKALFTEILYLTTTK